MNQVRLAQKRFKKILRRRKLAAHRRRVGPENYYKDRIDVVCVSCGQLRKLHQMTSVGGGLGIGQCRTCIERIATEDRNDAV